jgi:spoIIIJ-associated protein
MNDQDQQLTDPTDEIESAEASDAMETPADVTELESSENGSSENGSADPESTETELVEEGDIAADYIEELLDIADIDGDIDIDARAGRAYVSVSATGDSNLRLLSKPDTVGALQELTRLAVQNRTGRFSRLILDIGGSRDARAAELAALVDHAVARIEAGATSASLPPMSSYERKLVHDIVSERGFSSASEGEGRDRHTVITRG